MQKRYLQRWFDKPETYKTEYLFCLDPNEAAVCETQEQAQIECQILNGQLIAIRSESGKVNICNFKIEERKSGGFVFFYETF